MAKRSWWQAKILEQAQSGLSALAYCRQEGLDPGSFYNWRRKLKEPSSAERQPAFVPVLMKDAPAGISQVVLELRDGRALRLPESWPLQRMAELIRQLEARS